MSEETATIRVVRRQHSRKSSVTGELLRYGDEGKVIKGVMRAGCARGDYIRLDGCQAMVPAAPGRGEYPDGVDPAADDVKKVRPCTNDAKGSSDFCGMHSDTSDTSEADTSE